MNTAKTTDPIWDSRNSDEPPSERGRRNAELTGRWRASEERLDRALDAVAAERERQEQLQCSEPGRTHVCDPNAGNKDKFLVLAEEFGEVAEALQRPGQLSTRTRAHLRAELSQLAAVAVAWMEALEES
jgi:hypothetical protein